MLFRVAAVIAVVTLGSASAFAEPESKSLQVFRDIENQVNRSRYFTIFDDVEVAIDQEGIVMLTGSVTMPFKKNEIAKLVGRVDGVTEVRSAIEVLPVSGFDDDLRYRVARAIYGHSMFQHYGARLSPPIHIVVDGGHVTLTGVVDSEVDRALARSLAWQFGAFSVTNELRTNDEAKADLELLN